MKNRKLLLIVSMALAMMMSLGGTLAYLTDTDADVNVMTVGRVSITQNEQQRVEANGEFTSELEPFENDKMLLPVTYPGNRTADTVKVGDYDILLSDDEANYIDKIVSVTNDGNTDAYVRTLVAMPTGGEDWEEDGPVSAGECWLHWNLPAAYADHWTLVSTNVPKITIGNVNYYVWEFIHKEVLPAGETTYPMVRGIYMDQRVDINDDGKYYLDYGNGTVRIIENFTDANGKVNMLVLSQAVQAAGFDDPTEALDEAFDDVTATTAAEWFGGIVADYPAGGNNPPVIAKVWVSNDDELAEQIGKGETVIGLKAGTYNIPNAAKGKTLTLIGESEDAIIEVVPAGQGEANGQLDYNLDGSTVTFNNLTIKTNSQLYAGFARLSGTYNNCVIQNTYNLGTGSSEFNNCTINITNEYLRVGGASTAVFNGCTFNTDGRAILVFQDGTSVAQTVTVKDCTFNATAAANTWNGIHVAAVSIDGTNGTYVVNLEGTNTVDADFNGLWQIKTGDANVTVNE